MPCRMFSCLLGCCPLDTSDTSSCDDQKCLQHWLLSPGDAKSPPVKNHCPKSTLLLNLLYCFVNCLTKWRHLVVSSFYLSESLTHISLFLGNVTRERLMNLLSLSIHSAVNLRNDIVLSLEERGPNFLVINYAFSVSPALMSYREPYVCFRYPYSISPVKCNAVDVLIDMPQGVYLSKTVQVYGSPGT